MTQLEQAARQALEALEIEEAQTHYPPQWLLKAITALRAALEQPAQQEPVAYSYTSRITGAQGFSHHPMPRFVDSESWDIKPLYTTPPQRKPLTDEEITDAVRESDLDWHQGWTLDDDEPNRFISLARAIEAAHGIKGEA